MMGSLTMAGLLLVSGQVPSDVWSTNQRSLKIPIEIQPAQRQQIRELLLYVSPDQGKSWQLAEKVTSDKNAFHYHAAADGLYWFRVAAVNQQGKQEPEDIYRGPPDQKTLIDTLKPIIRLTAGRQGEDVVASWEIEENYPVPESLKVEYHAADTPPTQWIEVPVSAGPTGQARFRPKGAGEVAVRIQVKDRAGNQSFANTKVTGTGVATSSFTTPASGNGSSNPPPPVSPPSPAAGNSLEPKNEPPSITPPVTKIERPAPQAPTVEPRITPPAPWQNQGPTAPSTGAQSPGNEPRVAASTTPTPAAPAPSNVSPPAHTTHAPNRSAPQAQLVNDREVTLEYQLDRVGPSGIGSVELYLTRDEGQTWIRFAKDDEPEKGALPGGKYQRTLDLPGEGVFGLCLVVKSRAGMGKAPPRPGDAPEMVIEVDATPPVAQLFVPQADPQRRDALILSWSAKDRNLSGKPITLEWSEKRDGPWQPVEADLPNVGKYSWQVPKGVPVSVFLRLRVRDSAGNESVAATSEPQLIDLSEPEGRLLSVRPAARRQ